MTKNEAIQAMENGHKITHRFFEPYEWIAHHKLGSQSYRTEDGYNVGREEFWNDRKGEPWQTGWSIWEEAAPSTPVAVEDKQTELTKLKEMVSKQCDEALKLNSGIGNFGAPESNKQPLLEDFEHASDYMVALCKWEQQSKQPLYKVLNEQRTQGVLKCHKNLILDDLDEIGNWNFCGTNQNNINAQYATLAINNLHILAEALENIANNTDDLEAKRLAKQALNNIS